MRVKTGVRAGRKRRSGIYSAEVKGWLRAIEIARCLFEDQGYHRIYLNQMAEFIRRRCMYSPKIKEEFIPARFVSDFLLDEDRHDEVGQSDH